MVLLNLTSQLRWNPDAMYNRDDLHSHFRDLLHTKERQDETIKQLRDVLGESCISCELQLVGPEYESHHGIPSLSPAVAEELFRCELLDKETRSQALSPDMTKLKKTNVTMDNSLSPAHTLLQIHCADHKGLLYDILRTLKDSNIKVEILLFPLTILPDNINVFCSLGYFVVLIWLAYVKAYWLWNGR